MIKAPWVQLLRPPDDFEPLLLFSLPEREEEDFDPEDRSLPLALFAALPCSVCWFFPDGLLVGMGSPSALARDRAS
jgi:hypothetical protein